MLKDRQFQEKKQKAGVPSMKQQALYYAGIGARKTPHDILLLMEQLGNKLREDGMILRTGHAPGADQAFERGAGGTAQIFLPWGTFEQDVHFSASRDEDGTVFFPKIFNEPNIGAWAFAAKVHPAWEHLSDGVKKLHARNVHQILGPDLARPTPVEFVICWTPDGEMVGGTATALQLADERDIPIHNLADEDTYDMAFEWAWS
jgi:hypothetical protein